MNLDLRTFTAHDLERAKAFFEENGYLPLSGLDGPVVDGFRGILTETVGVAGAGETMAELLAPDGDVSIFPREVRHRLSRLSTPREFALTLLRELEGVLTALLGPLLHVSSTFHSQFKGGVTKGVDHYHNENAADFMELHGPWNLHQDFAGASLPTSPSALTLWVAMNTCQDWTLRLYPGSHRLGLYCHRPWKLDDERLAAFGPHVDLQAHLGTGVLFNALLLHGTSNPGQRRRVSCDLRFFPLCGFLPSEVHVIGGRPIDRLREQLRAMPGPVLQTPLLETLVFLGESVPLDTPPPHSSLNWVQYLVHALRGESDAALPYLHRFINTELLDDAPSVFFEKFHGRTFEEDRLSAVRSRVTTAAAL